MKLPKILLTAILFLVAFALVASFASADEIDDLTKAIDKLEAKIQKLKDQKEEQKQKEETQIYKQVDEPKNNDNEADKTKSEIEETPYTYAGGVEISGFFDVVSSYTKNNGDNTDFGLGQAEVDLAHELNDKVAVEVAVAYNSDESVFELGCAVADISLYSSEETFLSSINVITGQFDVPFGIDYFSYPSIDRKLITAPRVVDFTHGGWNDFGAQFYMESQYGNFVVYAVNGFEASAEVLDEVATLATGVEVYEEINTTPANAFGTRLGISPVSLFEIGTSFAVGLNQSDKSEMTLWGADLQVDLGYLYFKGEYITHSLNRSVAKENNKGYYLQSTGFINKFFITGRYGSFQPDGAEWIGQFSFGGGYAIAENVEIRLETLINENSDLNQTMFQLVTGF